MALYRYNTFGDTVFVAEKRFRYRSQAQERMVADNYCEHLGYFNGEGFIVISDKTGVLHRLALSVK